jgi:hypothetical protein
MEKEIIMQVYFENFNCQDDVVREFCITSEQLEGVEILYAWYGYGDYCGDSHVIFRKEGKLYEVNGSHCSCMGLEGQWAPEETEAGALLVRPNVADAAKAILQAL